MVDTVARPGFEPIFRSSPFLDLLGPVFSRQTEDGLLVGLEAQEKHCNARGLVHGGVLSSLADIALGYNAALQGEELVPLVTTSMTIDFAGSAALGDWVEIAVDVQKVGKRLAFANGYFHVDGKRIARASAVFSVAGSKS